MLRLPDIFEHSNKWLGQLHLRSCEWGTKRWWNWQLTWSPSNCLRSVVSL